MKRIPVVLSRPPEDVPSTSDPQAVEHVLVCPWPQAEWYQEGLYRQGMLLFTGAPGEIYTADMLFPRYLFAGHREVPGHPPGV